MKTLLLVIGAAVGMIGGRLAERLPPSRKGTRWDLVLLILVAIWVPASRAPSTAYRDDNESLRWSC